MGHRSVRTPKTLALRTIRLRLVDEYFRLVGRCLECFESDTRMGETLQSCHARESGLKVLRASRSIGPFVQQIVGRLRRRFDLSRHREKPPREDFNGSVETFVLHDAGTLTRT